MNKLRGFVFAMLLLFVVPVLASCGGEVVIRVDSFRFEQTTYTIKKDTTLQLEAVITPVEATNRRVSYSVISGEDYITVSETGLVTSISAGTSKVKAITDDGKFPAECTITVLNDPIVLDAPTGLAYNPVTKVISWNAVSNPLNNFSASYEVSITKDGVGPEKNITRLTTQSITAGGQYLISVKAIGDELLFNDSSATEYSFKILETPTTPTMSNGVLTVASVDEILDTTRYKLDVKRVVGSTTVALSEYDEALFAGVVATPNAVSKTISWEIPSGLTPNTYQFKVYVKAAGANVFDSGYSNTETNATFTQLAAPVNMMIDAGVLSWSAVTGASGYKIEVSGTDGEGEEQQFTYTRVSADGNTFSLPEEVTDLVSFAIQMQALGNGSTTLSSLLSVENAQQKLVTPSNLSVKSEDGLELSWDLIANAASYEVFFGNMAATVGSLSTDTVSGRVILHINSEDLSALALAAGQISVQVRAKPDADSTSYLISDKSASLKLIKLRAPTLSTRDGNIAWTDVANAQSFAFKIAKDSETVFQDNLGTDAIGFMMDASYAAGTYNVSLFAVGNGREILDSNESVKDFTRLATPQDVAINSNGVLSWGVIQGGDANMFELSIINTDSQTVSSIKLSARSYNIKSYLEGFGFGEYYFSVRALNNVASDAKINSDFTQNVTGYKLTAPGELKTEGGQILWAEVPTMSVSGSDVIAKSRYEYEIKVGSRIFVTSSTSVLPTGMVAGNYSVQIRTIIKGSNKLVLAGGGTVYLLPSDYAIGSITATKLAAPASLSISGGNLLWGKVTNAQSYIIETSWKDFNPTTTKTTTIPNPTTTEYAISSLMEKYEGDTTEYSGVCYITIRALGAGAYLNSDLSTQAQVFKLAAPTLSVVGGQLSWNKVYSEYNGMQIAAKDYTLQVNPEANFNGNGYSVVGSLVTVEGTYASGSPYSVSSGKVLIGGVTYSVASGKLTDSNGTEPDFNGTGYSISGETVTVTESPYAGDYTLSDGKVSIGGVAYFAKNGKLFTANGTDHNLNAGADGNIITTSALNGVAGGNYSITVRASSGTTSGTVVASSKSVSREITKLSKVTNFAGYSNSDKNNGVSWTPVTAGTIAVNYQFTVNEVELDGRLSLRVAQSNHTNSWYVFDDTLVGSDYRFQVRATSGDNNVISSDYTAPLQIKRIPRVQPLSINSSTVVSWSAVAGSPGYRVYIGDQALDESKVDSTNRRITLLGGSNPVLGTSETGTRNIKVVAIASGTALDSNGVLTISAAPSETLTVIRYAEATLSAGDGKLMWTNSNNLTNNGYRLIFEDEGGATVEVNLAPNSSSYDMNSISLNSDIRYSVRIIALGNSGRYLNSPSSSMSASVIRLVAPEWRVQNGILVWDDLSGATSYTVRTSDSVGMARTNSGIYKTEGSGTISFLPSAASGTLKFTIQAMGSTASTSDVFYVDSLIPTQSTVQKLAAPADLTVRDGEIVWNRAPTTIKIDGTDFTTISKYMVNYGGEAATINTSEDFFLSEYVNNTRRNMNVQVSAIGTQNSVGMTETRGIFLSSDYCNPKSVNINARPKDLTISNGKLIWNDDEGVYRDYEILATDHYNNTTKLTSTTRSSTLATLSGKFASIKVRHYGTVNGDGVSSPYVNSAYTEEPLLNVEKLAKPTTYIDEDGLFNWNKFVYATTTGLIMSVNGTYALNGNAIIDPTYDLRDIGSDSTVSKRFNMSGYAQGSSGDSRANGTYSLTDNKVTIRGVEYILNAGKLEDAAGVEPDFNGTADGNGYIIAGSTVTVSGYLYISSDVFTMDTYQFASVRDFQVIRGLKLSWDILGTTAMINGENVRNNLFVIEYRQNESDPWSTKIVNDLTETPLWLLGSYQVRISVRSSDANVIPSNPYALNGGSPITFNKFAAGDGSPTNPFIISTTTSADIVNGVALENSTAETKLGYINIIPGCYFRLAEDVALTSLATDSLLNNNMPKLYESDTNVYESILTGGFDGNGFKISNYQVGRKSVNSALWGEVFGADIAGFSGEKAEINFFGRSGVIQNLNLEIAKFDIDFTGQADIEDWQNPGQFVSPQYLLSFIAQYVYGGWISDCNISLSSDFGEDGIVMTDINCKNEIYYGGIAGLVASTGDGVSFSEARVMGCSSDVKIQLRKNNDNLQNVIRLGGIVAITNGAKIYNCVNNGDLMAVQVGGIVLISELAEIEGVSHLSVISGCVNTGTLTGLPISKGDTTHLGVVGGIVSLNNSGHVIYCMNSGEIKLLNGNYLTNGDTTLLQATAGGIAGAWGGAGKMINCLNVASLELGDHLTVPESGSKGGLGGLIGHNPGLTSGVVVGGSAFYDGTIANYTASGGGEGTGYGRATTELKAAGFVSGTTLNSSVSNLTYNYYGAGMLKPVFITVPGGYPTISWVVS